MEQAWRMLHRFEARGVCAGGSSACFIALVASSGITADVGEQNAL
ncbi:hypothetical protein RBWH47_02190 [Rhodopirellula baltica WH47]|uniref:Uncharacterized protein n=1 Tax=Rhodopirellula baltica WH47 TaxID=991778 RepID=F2AWG0_RHOBT|nr:hypothetical protein RBWH47_02190 [Rhodopirellula baltica WH47]